MTAQPVEPQPDTGPYEVIHLGGSAAVVVPIADFLRFRALEQRSSVQDREDAEDLAALQQWQAREQAGLNSYLSADEARARLGLA